MNLGNYLARNCELGSALAEAIRLHKVNFTQCLSPEATKYGLIGALFYSESPLLSQDSEGRLNFFNLGAQRVFGYSPEEAIGMKSVELVPPSLRTARADKFRHILEEKTSVEVQETRLTKNRKLIRINALIFSYQLDSRPAIVARVELLDANGKASASLRM